MFHLDIEYSDYTDMTDVENYPNGKAIDASTDEAVDGTPYTAAWRNQIQGMMEALWYAAFGTHSGITNRSDTVFDSDVLRAIKKLIDNDLRYTVKQAKITGYETVIDWGDLGINYDSTKKYAVMASLGEVFEGFLPIQSTVESDGVHLFATYLDNGKIKRGTKYLSWGSANWGEFNWGENTAMTVNFIIREVD